MTFFFHPAGSNNCSEDAPYKSDIRAANLVAELVAALFDRLGLVVTSVFTGTVCVTTGGGGSGSGPE
jgi:hypothetical protein|tara:strand:+ start:129 stop:329 length:201 start_codon:yes stop_codon:yes gene_type:complete